MSSSVGNLNIQLTAGIANFVQNMDKAAQKMTSFAGGMTASILKGNLMSAAITKVAGTLADLASSAITNITDAFQNLDGVDDLANRLGIATNNLIMLQFVSADAGVSNEMLAGSMTKLQMSMQMAIDGSKKQADAFSELGLNASQLQKMPVDKAMLKIGDALNQVGNKNEQAALAMAIFGKSGAEMMRLLGVGSEEIEKTKKRIEGLGGVIKDSDMTALDMANSSISTLKSGFQQMWNVLASQLAPVVLKFTDYIIDFATENKVAETVISGVWTTIRVSLNLLEPVWRALKLDWYALKLIWQGLELALVGGIRMVIVAFKNLMELFGVDMEIKFLDTLDKDLENINNGLEDTIKKIKEIVSGGETWNDKLNNAQNAGTDEAEKKRKKDEAEAKEKKRKSEEKKRNKQFTEAASDFWGKKTKGFVEGVKDQFEEVKQKTEIVFDKVKKSAIDIWNKKPDKPEKVTISIDKPGAILAGSFEEMNLGNDIQQRQLQIQAQQLQEAKKTNSKLDDNNKLTVITF